MPTARVNHLGDADRVIFLLYFQFLKSVARRYIDLRPGYTGSMDQEESIKYILRDVPEATAQNPEKIELVKTSGFKD